MKTLLSLALFAALAVPCLANGPALGSGKDAVVQTANDGPIPRPTPKDTKPKKHPKSPNPNNGPEPLPKGCPPCH
jgi:hypothetical protein